MADYAPILTRAIAALSENTQEGRSEIYNKARIAIDQQLRSMTPAPSEAAIQNQLAQLEEAIIAIENDQPKVEQDDPLEKLKTFISSPTDASLNQENEVTKEPEEVLPTPEVVSEPEVVSAELTQVDEAPSVEVPVEEAPVDHIAAEIEKSEEVVESEPEPEPEPEPAVAAGPVSTPHGFIDEVTLIDGVGPKIAEALAGAGVVSLIEIAHMNDAQLSDLSEAIGYPEIHLKDEWREQTHDMLAGVLPRAKSGKERLKKLKQAQPASAGGWLTVPATFVDEPILIDGVGEKTAAALAAAGVTSIAQIAGMSNAELANVTSKLNISGYEIKQEWKAQASAMLMGKQPRSKADQERLKKLKLAAPKPKPEPEVNLEPPKGFIEDVMLIDGIGEKTSIALRNEGVTKISQVAKMSDGALSKVAGIIGIPGFEKTQEWKAQAIEMINGELPRAENDKQQLFALIEEREKLKAKFENQVANAEQATPSDEPELEEHDTPETLPESEVEPATQADEAPSDEAPSAEDLAQLGDVIDAKQSQIESVVEDATVASDEVTDAAENERAEFDALINEINADETAKPVVAEAASSDEAKSDIEEEFSLENILDELNSDDEPAVESAANNDLGSVAPDIDLPTDFEPLRASIDDVSAPVVGDIDTAMSSAVSAELPDVAPGIDAPEFISDLDADFADKGASVGAHAGTPNLDAQHADAGYEDSGKASLARSLGCLGMLALLGGAAYAGWQNKEAVSQFSQGSISKVQNFLNVGTSTLLGETNEDADAPNEDKAPANPAETTVSTADEDTKKEKQKNTQRLGANGESENVEPVETDANDLSQSTSADPAAPAIEDVATGIEETFEPGDILNDAAEQVVEEVVPQVEATPEQTPGAAPDTAQETTPEQPSSEPEILQPVQVQPVEPEPVNTEPVTPEVVVPETVTPETVVPETPQVVEPETITPEAPAASVEPISEQGTLPVQEAQPTTTVASGETAFLYEEQSGDLVANRQESNVIWTLDQEAPADGLPVEPVIKGILDIPNKGLTMSLSIKRNVDAALPASHIIELIFIGNDSFAGKGVDSVPRLVAKPTEEARGEGLVGVPAKIDTGFFFIALNNLPSAMQTNERLLLESDWLDIPVGYLTGRRGLVVLRKGTTGNQVFQQAFADWKNR